MALLQILKDIYMPFQVLSYLCNFLTSRSRREFSGELIEYCKVQLLCRVFFLPFIFCLGRGSLSLDLIPILYEGIYRVLPYRLLPW